MHPLIREFPSLNFYGGALRDGPGVAQETTRDWHASPAFRPLVLVDVKGTVGHRGCRRPLILPAGGRLPNALPRPWWSEQPGPWVSLQILAVFF
jgi:hypothetical protein